MNAVPNPIRVLHVITRFIRGGAQENTLLTVRGLHAMPDIKTALVTGPGLGPEGDMLPDAVASGVEVIVIDSMRREIHPVRDWKAYAELRRVIRGWKPDIVHTHSSKAGILARRAARAERVPRIVHSIHGLPFHPREKPWRNRLYIALERAAAEYTDRIISVCDAMTDQAVAAGVAPRGKFVTVYSGMDLAPFLSGSYDRSAIRAGLGVAPDDLAVGVIARISPLKGHEFIIRAAPDILRAQPHARFLFVGDGHIRGEMEQLAASLGVRDRVIFAGLREPREIPELIAAMDLVVHTSLREGLARVLPQAFLSGVPVVAYDVDGAREVVVPGRTGWLVEAESIEGLSRAVVEALGDLGAAKRLAAAGRDLCRTRFGTDVMVNAIAAEYRRLFEGGGPGGPSTQ